MPRQVSQNEIEVILRAVARFPEGGSVEDIRGALSIPLRRRTLQRRLAMLVEQQRLIVEGRTRGSRYRLPIITGEAHIREVSDSIEAYGEVYIPITPEGENVKQAVRKPVQHRRPVSYNRTFLDDYRPKATFYLSAQARQHLLDMGYTPDGERPAGTYARLFNRLLIDLSWNSSRLEGNTYSLLETERLLELGEAAEGKEAQEAQMILNHKAAIELLVDQATEVGFNRYTLLNLHALLSDNLLADPQACGRLRVRPVHIGGTVYYPLAVPQLIEACFQPILDTAAAISDPFEQAFFAMVHLPYL